MLEKLVHCCNFYLIGSIKNSEKIGGIYLNFSKVANILAEIIDVDYDDITPETELTVENGIVPINVARLVMECEKKFKITIQDEDVHSFKYVNDILEYIDNIQS